jgi:hypothetical protein
MKYARKYVGTNVVPVLTQKPYKCIAYGSATAGDT